MTSFTRLITIAVLSPGLMSGLLAQSPVLIDDFNRADNTAVGGGWTEGGGSRGAISGNQLVFATGSTIAREWVVRTPAGYEPVLRNNRCVLTWAVNMKVNGNSDPSGFASGEYGIAYVLGGTSSNFTSGRGYAVVLGQSGSHDPVRLVRYANGLNGTLTTIITGSTDLADEFLAVKVTYDPFTEGWELFVARSITAFPDPITAPVSQGTATDNTYTGSTLANLGLFYNHGNSGTQSATFDNCWVPAACPPSPADVAWPGFFVGEFTCPASFSVTDNTYLATSHCEVRSSRDHLYRFTTSSTMDLEFSVCGAAFNTFIYLYPLSAGACSGAGSAIASNNDACGTASQVQVKDLPAGTYVLLIEGNASSDRGRYTLTINRFTAPVVTQSFEVTGNTWPIASVSGGSISNASGAGDTPANQRVLSTAFSYQVSNTTATLNLEEMDIRDYEQVRITARISATSSVSGNGMGVNDHVRFFVNLNGTGFPGTADLAVVGRSRARWGFSTGTGVASTTAGTPASFQPAGGGNRTTDGYSYIVIDIPAGTSTVALQVIARSTRSFLFWNVDNIVLSGRRCTNDWYSRDDGSGTSATWSQTPTGPLMVPSFTRFNSVHVQTGHKVIFHNGSDVRVNNLMVQDGASLDLGSGSALRIHGNSFTLDGILHASEASVMFYNTDPLTMSGTPDNIVSIMDLVQDAPGGVTAGWNIRILNNLQLTRGNFNANGKTIRLMSTASGTARLGPVGPTAGYTGDLQVDRYIPAGATNWRLLACPVGSNTLNDWKDDFITAGFPGSHHPNFQNPPGSGILWPSIRSYTESTPGPMANGLEGPAHITDPLTPGKGYSVWAGSNLNSTVAFTIDVTGPPVIAHTPVTLPVSYTNTGSPDDGWNLVGNPLPSPIRFADITKGADLQNAYWIFDPVSGTNAWWNGDLNIGSTGMTGTIQSSQAFWLKANGPAVTTTVGENAKEHAPLLGGFFGGDFGPDTQPLLRLRISTLNFSVSDEALVHFGAGEPGPDGLDMPQLVMTEPTAPLIATRRNDGQLLSLNAFGPIDASQAIPVQVRVPADGLYHLTIVSMGSWNGPGCMLLQDLETGAWMPLEEGAVLQLDLQAGTMNDRFVLHVHTPITFTLQQPLCPGHTGSATVQGTGNGPWSVTWSDADGNTLLQQNNLTGPASHNSLPPGTYLCTITGNEDCSVRKVEFTMQAPAPMEATLSVTHASCPDSHDGSVQVEVFGGTDPHTLIWSNGAQGATLDGLAPGSYAVLITDGNGCSIEVPPAMVQAGEPIPGEIAAPAQANAGQAVSFASTAGPGLEHHWTFGDGQGSTDPAPVHTYNAPGTYTVALTLISDECSRTLTHTIEVLDAAGLGGARALDEVLAYTIPGFLVVQNNIGVALDVHIFDVASRRTMDTKRIPPNTPQWHLPTQGWASGYYLVTLRSQWDQWTFSVVVVN